MRWTGFTTVASECPLRAGTYIADLQLTNITRDTRCKDCLSPPQQSRYNHFNLPTILTRHSLIRICTSNGALLAGIRIEECRDCNDRVGCHQQSPFQVVASPVEDEEIDDECGNE